MTVTYRNTFADALALTMFRLFRTSAGCLAWLPLLVPHGYLTFVGLTRTPEQVDSMPDLVLTILIVNLALAAVLLPLLFLLLVASAWLTTRRKGILTEHTLTLTNEAILETTDVNRTEHRWAGIHAVGETRRRVFLFVSRGSAHIVPKRAFWNPEAERAFVEFAVSRWRRHRPAV